MSGVAHLRSVAQGQLPADDGLLGNTLCWWGGAELISEEAILAGFTTQPLDLEGTPLAVGTASGAALIGSGGALVADLYYGRIGRLWRVGSAAPFPPEPSIDVAFDADMRQARGGLCFRAEDHSDLAPEATERVVAAGAELVERLRGEGKLRIRGFVVRAFGDAQGSAALIALHALSNELSRSASLGFAVVGIGPAGTDVQIAIDPPLQRAWTPRL